jgi:hypothetical protein
MVATASFRGVDLDHRTGVVTVVVGEILAFVLIIAFGIGAQRGLFLGMGGFFGQQGLAVLLGDLVVIGVDFAEGEETVTVAAEINESGLQRGFDPRYLGQIDIALDLLVISRIKVEFFNTIALEHRHPGLPRGAHRSACALSL